MQINIRPPWKLFFVARLSFAFTGALLGIGISIVVAGIGAALAALFFPPLVQILYAQGTSFFERSGRAHVTSHVLVYRLYERVLKAILTACIALGGLCAYGTYRYLAERDIAPQELVPLFVGLGLALVVCLIQAVITSKQSRGELSSTPQDDQIPTSFDGRPVVRGLAVSTPVPIPPQYSQQIDRLNRLPNTLDGMEQKIAIHESILRTVSRSEYPRFWALMQNNLGNAYLLRIQGNRADNVERAIAAQRAALTVRTRDRYPGDWAMTQNNLGAALLHRIHGDPAANIEEAIEALAAGAEIRTFEDSPVQWANTQNNLGNAYALRLVGDRSENQEKAIAAYESALKVRTQHHYPADWAATMTGLSSVYGQRIRGDREDNLDRAIAILQATLEVYTEANFPIQWAGVQEALGIYYANRKRGDRAENQERAIVAFQAALTVKAWSELGAATTYIDLGHVMRERIRGDRDSNREQAIAAYQAAIDAAERIGLREFDRSVYASLAGLHYEREEWSKAYPHYRVAVNLLEETRAEFFSEEAKTKLAENAAALYAQMIDTCLHLGRIQEAIERVEASKGRFFLEQIGTSAFPMPPVESAQQALLGSEARLAEELRALDDGIRNAPDFSRRRQLLTSRGEKWAALNEAWARLEPHAPDYVALRRGDPILYGQMRALGESLGPQSALAEFYVLPDRILVFVLRSGQEEPKAIQAPVTREQLQRYVDAYRREVTQYPQYGDIGQRWQELAMPLLADALPHLEGAALVYLVPHGLLHSLPLHALQVDGKDLIDRFAIAYAPSAAVLARVIQRRRERERKPQVLVMGNPTQDLRHAEEEATQVAQMFGTQAYVRREATKARVKSELEGKDIVHLACHGFFHPVEPLQSGIVFAGHERLTAHEMMELRLQADLVALSACETGQSEVSTGDELVGLTRALLYAGASSALVSLWAVGDESTGQLMTSFYRRLYDGGTGKAKAVALREAMLEVREKRGHPFYWAPFILAGDWR